MRRLLLACLLVGTVFMIQCGGSFHPAAQTQGPPGPQGPQGAQGPAGPQGPQGPTSAFGDGSAGSLVISGTVDWTQNPPSSTNLQFTSVDVQAGGTWTIPSGLTIRTVGDFQVDGSVVVATGPIALSYGYAIPAGVSSSVPDQQGNGQRV
jgi:hypothetical protein